MSELNHEVNYNELIEVSSEEFKSRINTSDTYIAEMQAIDDALDEGQTCFNYVDANNNYLGSIIFEDAEARHLILEQDEE